MAERKEPNVLHGAILMFIAVEAGRGELTSYRLDRVSMTPRRGNGEKRSYSGLAATSDHAA